MLHGRIGFLKKPHRLAAIVLISLLGAACNDSNRSTPDDVEDDSMTARSIELPRPSRQGERSLEETLATRRSVREFADRPLTNAEISQLLWAAQGITHPDGLRTAPSAGALYPLEIHVATSSGHYRYEPVKHELEQRDTADLRRPLHHAALAQDSILEAPAVIVITAVHARTARKYGARAERYVHMEAGHAAQNLLLEAVALGLAGVPVGAFDDDQVSKVLRLPDEESPLYMIPVGHPR
jgi:SagB-type dehydrogenase family enzyme